MKKRYIAVVLILILTMMSAVSVSAADGERPNIKKVTVGVGSKNGFAYKNANGSEEGYAIDYLNQLGAECGYDIDVVIVENEKLFDNLVFNRCDFVLTDDNPEKYLEYEPQKEKTLEQKVQEQEETIRMLKSCLLEMSEAVYA